MLVVVAAGVGLTRTPIFRARTIEVVGAERLTEVDVTRIAGVGPETNTVYFDPARAEAALENEAWVANATVVRRWPSTLEIVIDERVPVAVVAGASGNQLVAGDGLLLGPATTTKTLPTIESSGSTVGGSAPIPADSVAGAAAILRAMSPAVRAEVDRVLVQSEGRFGLELRDGTVVAYGASLQEAEKASVLTAILRWGSKAGRRLASVDLRVPGAPVTVLAKDERRLDAANAGPSGATSGDGGPSSP